MNVLWPDFGPADLDKAIEEYDNAPIGREEKAEKALKENLEKIFLSIKDGNNLGEPITLVGATKMVSPEVINDAVALGCDYRITETVSTAVVLNGSLAGIPAGVEGLAAVHILYVEIAVSVADNRASALALCVDIGLRAHAVSANAAAEVIDTAENS